jgi:type III restriction enzyme
MSISYKLLTPDDLVLKLKPKVKNLDLSKYEDFVEELCGDWEFQKESIRHVIAYFISNEYSNSKDLLLDNLKKNKLLKQVETEDFWLDKLAFPDKKACTLDLATGTGKTWVIYAVARILLAEGMVDQVLVLCPSKTIKDELSKKFNRFTQNSILTAALPAESIIKVPGIKHSDETIERGDICIDNVHKTYDHVSSSITDSLEGKGNRTLVINDEAHHVLNPKTTASTTDKQSALEWMKFLKDKRFSFKYILNVSGTPYKGNNYFNDVIYRFSIRDAIKCGYVKDINYLKKDESENWDQKWKAIYVNHENLKKEYSKAKKHITIVVTNTIRNSNKLVEEVKAMLADNSKMKRKEIEKKVIAVTSSPSHEENREILKTVDQSGNPVEWIVSVSMLTEGWDVSNIFQIVPHENRAFNSKLLISQVLGRGLRVPKEYRSTSMLPQVWVFNHTAWSDKIDNLVREVAEISRTIKSDVIKSSKYNFNLHYINCDKKIVSKKATKAYNTKLPETLGFASTPRDIQQVFVDIKKSEEVYRTTNIDDKIRKFSILEATNSIYSDLFLRDMANNTDTYKRVKKPYIKKLIEKELKKIGEEKVSEYNLQRGKRSFNVLTRASVGQSHIEDVYGDAESMNTKEMRTSYVSENALKTHGSLIIPKEYKKKIPDEDRDFIKEIKSYFSDNEENLNGNYEIIAQDRIIEDISLEKYKSPLSMTFLSHVPEKEFAKRLIREYSKYFDAWVKSKDKGFYEIPYIHRPGTHSLDKEFNPDFFIKKGKRILVVEIKDSSESAARVKNKDKLEGAKTYFKELNKKLKKKKIKYEFYFLDPSDYTNFFETVLVNEKPFIGSLQAELESKTREELKGEQ